MSVAQTHAQEIGRKCPFCGFGDLEDRFTVPGVILSTVCKTCGTIGPRRKVNDRENPWNHREYDDELRKKDRIIQELSATTQEILTQQIRSTGRDSDKLKALLEEAYLEISGSGSIK